MPQPRISTAVGGVCGASCHADQSPVIGCHGISWAGRLGDRTMLPSYHPLLELRNAMSQRPWLVVRVKPYISSTCWRERPSRTFVLSGATSTLRIGPPSSKASTPKMSANHVSEQQLPDVP